MKQSTDLKAFFNRQDVCQILHDEYRVGWFDGGCLVAASVIGRYLGTGQMGCIYNRDVPQHFCWLYGTLVLDADGAMSRLGYTANYARRESLPEPSLKVIRSNRKIKQIAFHYGFVRDEALVRRFTAMLKA